jgi:hypothetical protein
LTVRVEHLEPSANFGVLVAKSNEKKSNNKNTKRNLKRNGAVEEQKSREVRSGRAAHARNATDNPQKS